MNTNWIDTVLQMIQFTELQMCCTDTCDREFAS